LKTPTCDKANCLETAGCNCPFVEEVTPGPTDFILDDFNTTCTCGPGWIGVNSYCDIISMFEELKNKVIEIHTFFSSLQLQCAQCIQPCVTPSQLAPTLEITLLGWVVCAVLVHLDTMALELLVVLVCSCYILSVIVC
jgi:hypothetical protein